VKFVEKTYEIGEQDSSLHTRSEREGQEAKVMMKVVGEPEMMNFSFFSLETLIWLRLNFSFGYCCCFLEFFFTRKYRLI
jgi:hypothetical protein